MKKVLNFLLILFLIVGLGYIFVPPFLYDVNSLKNHTPELTALMRHRIESAKKNKKSYKIYKTYVPLSRISPYLVKAVLIAEDDKFYRHEGFDLEGIKIALEKNIKKKKLQYGGSTISQQLAKNLFLGPRKTLIRKIQEAVLTIRIEKKLTKKRILELYLNIAEWGPGIFGAEGASRFYFQKPALNLTPEEAALLASVLPNPLKYNPSNPSRYVKRRAEKILYIMKLRNIIPEEYEKTEESQKEVVTLPDSDSILRELPHDSLEPSDRLRE
ncbi:MAG: monofunctional biosynthetic peptidoglycan transglycosylase [Candidatus Hydrothermia bacterium]|jgi:monofunctional biosynthetic peptidoglycan transglycosylase